MAIAAHAQLSAAFTCCYACGARVSMDVGVCACGANSPPGGWDGTRLSGRSVARPHRWKAGVLVELRGPLATYRAVGPAGIDPIPEGRLVLLRDLQLEPQFAMRQAAMERVRHPMIAPPLAHSRVQGFPYRVDPHLDAPTARQRPQPLDGDVVEVAAMATRVCGAVQALHRAGIVHGHLHADAVLIAHGQPLLTTPPAVAAGPWLPFVAPEVRRGQSPTTAADVFGLGLMVVGLLTEAGAIQPDDTGWAHLVDEVAVALPACVEDHDPLADTLRAALCSNPALRPTLAELGEALAATTAYDAMVPPPPIVMPSLLSP